MNSEYLDAWDLFFRNMLPDQARMLDDKDPETFLGKQWLTKNEDVSWMIEN